MVILYFPANVALFGIDYTIKSGALFSQKMINAESRILTETL